MCIYIYAIYAYACLSTHIIIYMHTFMEVYACTVIYNDNHNQPVIFGKVTW